MSQTSGRRTSALAQALRRCYALTRDALGHAEIGLSQAERLVATLSSVAPRVEPARLAEAEAMPAKLADEFEPRGFARPCATMAAALDPDGAPPDDDVDRAAANVLRISEATSAGMRRLSGWLTPSGVGTLDWAGDLSAEAARRLACDAGAVPVRDGGGAVCGGRGSRLARARLVPRMSAGRGQGSGATSSGLQLAHAQG